MDELQQDLVSGAVRLPQVGSVIRTAEAAPCYAVMDGEGDVIPAVAAYLRDLALSDVSPMTLRSYAHDLLRWWRLLSVLNVAWDRASRTEVEVLIGWMRSADNRQRRRGAGGAAPGTVNLVTGKRTLRLGYAPRTINHQLSVLASFYAFHATFGHGPVINPVPGVREVRERLQNMAPWDSFGEHRRGPLRQKVARAQPRSIPDAQFDALMGRMGNHRDRAMLTILVSSGARAAELLGLRSEHVDWAGQRIYVVSKGSRELEPIPVSPEALRHLALYFDQHGVPAEAEAVFRTTRGPSRPLTYGAARRVMQRANAALGSNWTLHDLRHTLVMRLATDPALTLPEIMTVTRHRRVDSMTPYLQPRIDETFDKLQEHYLRPRTAPTYAAGYDPEDMRTVFGA